jgi:hypothetical protein
VGKVSFERQRLRCINCGQETVPLDRALGLAGRTTHSLEVEERCLLLATEMSHAKASRTAGEMRGWEVSHGRINEWAQEVGAELEKEVAEAQAPFYLLDWYHLVENLRYGLGHRHPRLGRTLELARAGHAYDLIQLLERAARRLDDPEQIPRCRKLVDYVYANRRLKSRGMSWRRRGAHHMVRLRLLRLNNRWDEFWNQRRQAQRREWPVAA